MTPDDLEGALVQLAARNNAELCDLVGRAHGLDGRFTDDMWTSDRRTPQYYPDAVSLRPRVEAPALLSRIDSSDGASVKDSFATLDLRPAGFRVLLSAEWIARAATTPPTGGAGDDLRWTAITDAARLVAWEAARSVDGAAHGVFPSSFVRERDVVVLQGEAGGAIRAGAILNRSERVVGVSNLFSTTDDLAGAWAGCLDEVSRGFPGRAVVGYESGGALDAARRIGFQTLGPLRVWVKD